MKFALLALPRSGTTWAANWLSTGGVLCHHDPLMDYLPETIPADSGISCTTMWLMPPTLDCPVVLLDRDPDECNASLRKIGFQEIPEFFIGKFQSYPGPRFHWRDLFDNPEPIWKILRPDCPFDKGRHELLRKMNVQPNFDLWHPNMDVLKTVCDSLVETTKPDHPAILASLTKQG